MSVRLCNVDLRGDAYVVVPYSRTVDGFWIIDGNPVRLAPDASGGELGSAVRAALQSSRQDVATPPREAALDSQLLSMFAVPDYATYARGARSVGVRLTDTDQGETVTLTPKMNGGPTSGFTPIRTARTTLTYDSPAQLGDAVIQALARSVAQSIGG